MGVEIERKFLVQNGNWQKSVERSFEIKQGYLNSDIERTVRIRIVDSKGVLTIKGKNVGALRPEFEYDIPIKDARDMMRLCEKPIIEKVRHLIVFGGHTWELDVFAGENEGLVVAEVELKNEEVKVDIPEWVGKEVTHESKYYNSNLIKNPYSNWT